MARDYKRLNETDLFKKKELSMTTIGSSCENKKFNDWLGGMTFNEKLQTLESGKLVQCVICNKIFFDKESLEERRSLRCKSTKVDHECVEYENYIILKRGFRGLQAVVNYSKSISAEDSILRYFKNRK